MSTDGPRLNLTYFIYPSLSHPFGHLPTDKRAQACWYFYTIAHKAMAMVGDSIDDQILYEDEPWMDTRFEAQARAVAVLYELDSPDEFAKFWDYVAKQAHLMGLPQPSPRYAQLIRRVIH